MNKLWLKKKKNYKKVSPRRDSELNENGKRGGERVGKKSDEPGAAADSMYTNRSANSLSFRDWIHGVSVII